MIRDLVWSSSAAQRASLQGTPNPALDALKEDKSINEVSERELQFL